MVENVNLNNQLNTLQSKIVVTLAYFDLFKFPLTHSEIIKFSKISSDQIELIQQELNSLTEKKIIYNHQQYYSLSNSKELDVKRENGQKYAERLMKKAVKYSNIINSFPFVRSVCISGSLSKGCVDEQGDIDYFIVTEPQRLWITRTLLIAFKKLFLLNSHKYFCVNYFVDTKHLEIPDKNIFTATELLTLLPMNGKKIYYDLIQNNEWAYTYLPNVQIEQKEELQIKKLYLKLFLEKILSGSLGDFFDTFFMNLTIKKWKSKFKNFDEESLDTALRSRKYVSKHHPQQFQKVVLTRLESSISQLHKQFNLKLHD
ncbi:MAG: nucleotidyltransferase domain-containing protein [Bacteroidia bacterium]